MLITVPYKVGDIISLKLVSGEEVVARLEDETADYLNISKPVSLGMGPQGPALTPFMLTSDVQNSIKIKLQHVLAIGTTNSQVGSQYMQATTGIAMPA
jgi:hypothetical protein